MKNIITFLTFLFLSSFLNAKDTLNSNYSSTYTSIEQKDCITLDSDNLGSIQECESFSNIKVKVIEGDIRQSITLTRNEKEYELEFWSTVSSGFSSLGSKIEWRHKLSEPQNPKGMIVRLEVNDDPEDPEHVSSYLVVSKITNEKICVVAKVLPQEKQNEVARKMLDTSTELLCVKEENLKKPK
jgi:hypothetical protein